MPQTQYRRGSPDGCLPHDFNRAACLCALAVEGMQAAIGRACACVEAGTDTMFPEAMTELAMYKKFADAVKVPILANITDFGVTPLSAVAELKSADAAMVPYPPPALRAMNAAALKVFQALRKDGAQKDVLDTMQTSNELYDSRDYHAYEHKPDPLFAKDRKK